jgi:hypothetical protein
MTRSVKTVRMGKAAESPLTASQLAKTNTADTSAITPLALISATTQQEPPAVTLTAPTPRATLTRSSSVREARGSVLIPKAVVDTALNQQEEDQKQKAAKKSSQKSLSKGLRLSMQNLFSSEVKKNANPAQPSPSTKSSKP